MLQDSKNRSKKVIKRFLSDNNTTITPEQVLKRFYREMTIEEAEDLLEEMVNTDDRIGREELKDGFYVYHYKYVPKKPYYY